MHSILRRSARLAARRRITPERATVIAAMLALAGTIVAALLSRPGQPEPAESHVASAAKGAADSVEVDGLTATQRRAETVLLDLKVRNPTATVALLTHVVAHVDDWRVLENCGVGAPPPESALYRLTIPLDPPAEHFDIPVDLNEQLPPNSTINIRIQAGLDTHHPFIDGMLLRLRLELQFNKSAADVSEPILISLPGPLTTRAQWTATLNTSSTGERGCVEQNLADLDFMLSRPGGRIPDLNDR
jgi:hypothetical protein